ncbi:MAG: LytTR family transcriptional regulator DNA-binding domain-containing protein [Chitinophagaceae bacterium]
MLTNLKIAGRNEFFEKTEAGNFDRRFISKKKRTRLLVQKGIENILLKLDDIAFFYTEDKLVYVIDRSEKKYLIDKNLLELENELEPSVFFRANRQYLVSINFIKSYRSYENVKIKVDLDIQALNHLVIVSQENAPNFRKWISEA